MALAVDSAVTCGCGPQDCPTSRMHLSSELIQPAGWQIWRWMWLHSAAAGGGGRPSPWPGTEPRTSTLLLCTMLGAAAVTAVSMLLASRFMQGGSSSRYR